MKLVSLALFYLGSVSFFGVEAAKLDIASDFKRKWSRWALSRVRRDATLTEADGSVPPHLVQGREATGEASRREEGHIRLKRQDSSPHFHMQFRVSCKMGTCSVAKLADQIFHLNNKEKVANAPARKISSHGYGRRRRSLLDTLAALKSSGGSSSRMPSRRLASSVLSLSPEKRHHTTSPFEGLVESQ